MALPVHAAELPFYGATSELVPENFFNFNWAKQTFIEAYNGRGYHPTGAKPKSKLINEWSKIVEGVDWEDRQFADELMARLLAHPKAEELKKESDLSELHGWWDKMFIDSAEASLLWGPKRWAGDWGQWTAEGCEQVSKYNGLTGDCKIPDWRSDAQKAAHRKEWNYHVEAIRQDVEAMKEIGLAVPSEIAVEYKRLVDLGAIEGQGFFSSLLD